MRKKIVNLSLDMILILLLIGIDQATKYLAITLLKNKPAYILIHDVFELNYLENRGSAFGMLQNQKIFILFVGFVLMFSVIYFLIKMPDGKKYVPLHLCISGIIAGGVGNMIDRFRFDYVVDFFSFVLIHFPIFNVADCYIVIAVIVLCFLFLFFYKESDLEFLSFKQNKYREVK